MAGNLNHESGFSSVLDDIVQVAGLRQAVSFIFRRHGYPASASISQWSYERAYKTPFDDWQI